MDKIAAYQMLLSDHPLWEKEARVIIDPTAHAALRAQQGDRGLRISDQQLPLAMKDLRTAAQEAGGMNHELPEKNFFVPVKDKTGTVRANLILNYDKAHRGHKVTTILGPEMGMKGVEEFTAGNTKLPRDVSRQFVRRAGEILTRHL